MLISLTNVAIGSSNKLVLNNVNFEINKGQHWAFTGESGSGKTLLLQAIAGNIPATQGTIDYSFTSTDGIKHQIGFAGAKHSFRNLSNTSDLYYQQRYNSSDSDDALSVSAYLKNVQTAGPAGSYWTVEKAVDLLTLSSFEDKQLIKLSNGETKRLLIAAALVKNPSLLLIDNPLAGLDVQTRSHFDGILSKIKATGITIIITTSEHEIPEIITHLGIINNGNIEITTSDRFKASHLKSIPVGLSDFNLTDLIGNYPSPPYHYIVNMEQVNVRYGDKQVLNNINWQVLQGERWALLGPNGAGKSTLLSLINGDNPQAYANNITLFDRKRGSGESIWDIKKKTGFISPELYQYFPADTLCLQAIESGYYDTIGLFRHSDPVKAAKALQWLTVIGISQYAKQPLKNIPAGAQRLCLLARAMIKCPVLLILDEPCQGMDNRQVQHFKALINTICRQTNITLIYVTHYPEHIPDSVGNTLKLNTGTVISS